MQEIFIAIWQQDFDALLALSSLQVLLLLLAIVLLVESSLVFLPLPGDGLVLFVGGLVGIGALDLQAAVIALSFSAFLGSVFAYFQGRWLHNTSFMRKIETTLPDDSLPKAKHLLDKYGFLSLFVSRFIPFVRVLTPMLMGVAQLSFWRTLVISLSSSIIWVVSLLLTGKWLMRHPYISQYQEGITKWFVLISLALMLVAFLALVTRVIKRNLALKTVKQSTQF
ncbi:DedA family protein [Alginatibacterium sediminis]|uniref:DedA family protein n=1 Tax=Alginatibacterium sediminis TaxID=2164068 RepID=A0A420E6E1_9ALTE|nr:DedA family protein [Alginatibacterium sediminis]RKF13651.1 DedA family protein [Alginatibacterium sediminis]